MEILLYKDFVVSEQIGQNRYRCAALKDATEMMELRVKGSKMPISLNDYINIQVLSSVGNAVLDKKPNSGVAVNLFLVHCKSIEPLPSDAAPVSRFCARPSNSRCKLVLHDDEFGNTFTLTCNMNRWEVGKAYSIMICNHKSSCAKHRYGTL